MLKFVFCVFFFLSAIANVQASPFSRCKLLKFTIYRLNWRSIFVIEKIFCIAWVRRITYERNDTKHLYDLKNRVQEYKKLIEIFLLCFVLGAGTGNEFQPLGIVFNRCNPQGSFCEINRGTPAVMYVRFSPRVNHARALNGALHALRNNAWQLWNLNHRTNVCNFLKNEQQCPISVGQQAIYELRFVVPVNVPVRETFPLHFRIQDQNGQSVACFIVNVFTRT